MSPALRTVHRRRAAITWTLVGLLAAFLGLLAADETAAGDVGWAAAVIVVFAVIGLNIAQGHAWWEQRR